MRSALATLVAAATCALAVALPACAPGENEVVVGSSSSRLGGTPAYPFGARLDAYRFGIRPNHVSDAQMDAVIKQHYDAWKANLVVDVPTVPGGKAVKFNQTGYLAVSEGMGYGMLLTVLMAGYDGQAQAIFDGLLRTVRARPAYSIPNGTARPYLMDWRLAGDGSSTDAAGGGWNALDADEDIAMALLMADRQWGSAGAWNYKQEGINTINAMKVWNMKPDGTPMANLRTSRTSDYMIGHFRAYAAATGDGFWNTAVDRSFDLVNRMQTTYSSAGLVPDFIVDVDTASPRPSPGGQIESPWEGNYFANGQRDPWRWGTDYVFSGDARWKGVLTKMTDFFVKDNGGSPGPASDPIGTMKVGYHLDGTSMNGEFGNPWPARGLVAGAMNGAQSDARYQTYVNACWDWLVAKWVPSYYDAELTLLSEIVAAGDWWNPGAGSGGGAPAPAPSSSTSSSMRVQAESGQRSGAGVSVMNDIAGFDGTGFVGSFTTAGDRLTVSFANVNAGSGDLHIRYHAWNAQRNDVVINGVTRNEDFPATGAGWADKVLSGVSLAGGTNTVAIAKDWGWMEVDYLELTGVATSAPTSTTPAQMRREAETGATSGSGVGVHTDLAGFEGSGFVGSFTANGDQLALGFTNVPAASYGVRIRYHAWTDQHNDVSVNGAARDVFFPATGGGWGIVTVPAVALPAGTTTVVVRKNWGYTDIDWIELAP